MINILRKTLRILRYIHVSAIRNQAQSHILLLVLGKRKLAVLAGVSASPPHILAYRLRPFPGALFQQRAPARGARGVRREPLVDAPDVEPVVALGEHPDLLPVRELAEAYGALGRRRDVRSLAVHSHRDPAERLPLEPRRRQPRGRLLGGLERQPPPAPERAPHDRVEPQREYKRAQQRRQDDDHVGVEVGVATPGGDVRRPCPVGPRRRLREASQIPANLSKNTLLGQSSSKESEDGGDIGTGICSNLSTAEVLPSQTEIEMGGVTDMRRGVTVANQVIVSLTIHFPTSKA
ncbi:hypothetical protein ZIOFF_023158 [Zingiber officinale]|uniref:Uncharacterized protein n=1 Tax=Zingiber officinale TaxID=94328 RepID=A0A8J5HAS2_ZINOF|nr:hypothetical protein ZIOFF_023158 [Zingiber officinale]